MEQHNMITDDRKKELASMSDAWLREVLEIHSKRTEELKWEFNRRFPPPERKKLVEFPCTLQDLETAIHSYGDHHGFHGKVVIVPASDADDVNEGIGVEEEQA